MILRVLACLFAGFLFAASPAQAGRAGGATPVAVGAEVVGAGRYDAAGFIRGAPPVEIVRVAGGVEIRY